MSRKTPSVELRTKWEAYADSHKELFERSQDEVWRRFKAEHSFDPAAFEKRPPWCIAGAENNTWAAKAFLGSRKREAAWAAAGYLDNPFHFAYLWLDHAGFTGLLRGENLPYTIRTTRSEMKRKARVIEGLLSKASVEVATWPFRDLVNLDKLVRDSDYTNSITIPATAREFTQDQIRIGTRLMLSGARQQLLLPLGGRGSLLDRAAKALSAWQPPASLVDRPNRPGLRQRFAARWLDLNLAKLGSAAMPSNVRFRFIAELIAALGELGQWREDPWTEEQVRRCLDGKPRRLKRDSV